MMDEIIQEFLIESHESLEAVDNQLVQLERDPQARDELEAVFRTVHTIKGTAGALGFAQLERVAHAAEHLLDDAREDRLDLSPTVISALLAAVDATRSMLAEIEEHASDDGRDFGQLLERLEAVREQARSTGGPVDEDGASSIIRLDEPGEDNAHEGAGAASATPDATELPDELEAPLTESAAAPHLADQTLRVSVDLLERLMNLVGELVLTRNQIIQHVDDEEDREFLATTQRLNLITSELQESIMRARMKPIGKIWNKFPRLVRDISRACGKKVRVEMDGRDTELDRTLIEAMNDPLIHLVRNAVDHGIEAPEVRRQAGKPEEGRVSMSARHRDGQVHIEISDDGRGIDVERLRETAVTKGLVTAEHAATMSEKAMFRLIFAPGFTTAKTLTSVSGRGVGMDVVRTNIERIGGSIDVSSTPGKGTTIEIEIPLTLAIIPALIVRCGASRYAIPQVNLIELVRLDTESLASDVETIYDAPVYRLRGKLLPLVFLHRELGLTQVSPDALAHREHGLNIVIVQVSGEQFGLVVDAVVDTEEIVVKPLSPQLADIRAYAGATIMGDGSVALILDIPGIARSARVLASRGELRNTRIDDEGADSEVQDTQRALLVATKDGGRLVMPLCQVNRLEKIGTHNIEIVGGEPCVQYRSAILPLVYLSDVLAHTGYRPDVHQTEDSDESTLQVVVYARDGRQIGLVVHQIIDIVDTTLDVQLPGGRHGVLGSSVVQGRVTEVFDIDALLGPGSPDTRAPETRAIG
jgi:two-component system chemotaxis sensor kinase CheA